MICLCLEVIWFYYNWRQYNNTRGVAHNLSHTLHDTRIFELCYLHLSLVNSFACQACHSILKLKCIVVAIACTGLPGCSESIKTTIAALMLRSQLVPHTRHELSLYKL